MKVLLDIKDSKAPLVLALLKELPYVKAKPLTKEKALLLDELKEAADYMADVKNGKQMARPASDLMNEL